MTHHAIPNLQIIGLTGAAGAGKDSVANILVTHLGFVKLAFADALREEVCEAFNIPKLSLIDRKTKELPSHHLALRRCQNEAFIDVLTLRFDPKTMDAPQSPRQIMQWWGTEYRRSQDAFYWTKKLQEKIKSLAKTHQRIVVSDVRFDNEVQALAEQNLKIESLKIDTKCWHILRGSGGATQPSSHSSEAGIARNHIDAQIYNDHTLIDLVGPVLLQWLALEANQNLETISSSQNMVYGWQYH